MSGNPYENEPGFEDANETSDKKNQKDYVEKVARTTRTRQCAFADIVA